MATALLNKTVTDLFSKTYPPKRKLKRKAAGKLIARQLNEVIYGTRPYIEVYSKTLQHHICFVNEGLINPHDINFDGKIITMKMLADIASNSKDVVGNVQAMLS